MSEPSEKKAIIVVSVFLYLVHVFCGNAHASCGLKEYGISDGKQVKCKPCSSLIKCPHGLGVSIACGDVVSNNIGVQCVPCVLGKTFSASYDSLPCKLCRSMYCVKNEEVVGKCLPDRDNTVCNGTCKKGFYPNGDTLRHCTPCSLCRSNSSQKVEKCKNDGMPLNRQCRKTTILPILTMIAESDDERSERPFLFAKEDAGELRRKDRNNAKDGGYKIYGHPALFGTLLMVIFFLVVYLIYGKWKKKRKTTNQTNGQKQKLQEEIKSDTDESTFGQLWTTDNWTSKPDQKPDTSVRQRRSSASSAKETKNVANASSEQRENDLFDENSSHVSEKKTTPGGTTFLYKRQNSNPEADRKMEKPRHKRSKSTGSSSNLKYSVEVTEEETTPILPCIDENGSEGLSSKVNLAEETTPGRERFKGLRVGNLNDSIYKELCDSLNHKIHRRDWRTLAGCMGLNNNDVKIFERLDDPANGLLSSWGTTRDNDVFKLIQLLEQIGRSDLVEKLESSMPYT